MTTISWTDETWNPWQGCSRVSLGCANCYMFTEREGRFGIPSNIITRSSLNTFRKPLKIKEPSKIFTCSWSDFFHDGADEWRDDAWNIIRNTPQHIYQILTKRSHRILDHLPKDWGDGWPNVWLGVSVENHVAMHRALTLADIPARVRFISAEPLLGPLEMPPSLKGRIHWLISGGESGPKARPADLEWFRSLRDQCVSMNISYWHKQNGGHGRNKGGVLLDGNVYQGFPKID